MHRFFLENQGIRVNQTVDLSPLAHQLRSVLRLSAGTMIQLLDGKGDAFLTEIQRLDAHQAIGFVQTQAPATDEPSCHLTLYQCSLKRDKFEWILQKGTELGVSCFVPVISQRSIVRPKEALTKKYKRWQVIIREAAEQCRRGLLPVLAQPLTWDEAIAQAAGLRLLPWERIMDAPESCHLKTAIEQSQASLLADSSISLMIGPEGGITEEEAVGAHASGWQSVSLGRRILRAETAALASTAIIMSCFDS